jgi:drug/metabolite transporter (DMT)-like permease
LTQSPSSSFFADRAHRLGPGVLAAATLGASDVLAKIVLASGCDVLTMLSVRSLAGVAMMFVWLRIGQKPAPANARVRWISMGVGVLFAGLIFCLFKAIEAIDVPTAILSYFAYPLITGLAGSATGLEILGWRGAVCALAAFFGLGVMIGAHPAGLALVGVAYALGAALCRTGVLLVTRAYLRGADARLTTWYSVIASTILFVAISIVSRSWQPPQTALGWSALIALSIATTAGILLVFVSTVRVGPFQTALIMNLEPLTATILSAPILGEIITPIQAAGAAILLGALVAFQMRR